LNRSAAAGSVVERERRIRQHSVEPLQPPALDVHQVGEQSVAVAEDGLTVSRIIPWRQDVSIPWLEN
jgi:hypothetical protein